MLTHIQDLQEFMRPTSRFLRFGNVENMIENSRVCLNYFRIGVFQNQDISTRSEKHENEDFGDFWKVRIEAEKFCGAGGLFKV